MQFNQPMQFFFKSLYDTFMDLTKPMFGFYSQYRPIILLPFNIWFFFASLPFRMFFFFYNNFLFPETPSHQLKLKAMELKETGEKKKKDASVSKRKDIPEISVTKPTELRQRSAIVGEDQPFSWYSVSSVTRSAPVHEETIMEEYKAKFDEIKQKQEELMPQISETEKLEKAAAEEKLRLETQLNEFNAKWTDRETKWTDLENKFNSEKRSLESQLEELSSKFNAEEKLEKAFADEKLRLESQLKDLTMKYNEDEKALASFEQERSRLKQLVAVQQKKSFDFQQDLIALKNQLRSEQESRLKAEQELESMRKQSKSQKLNNKKQSKKASSSTLKSSTTSSSSQTESTQEKPAVIEAQSTKPAWSVQHHENDYTEMVAAAQREELEHKKFSEVVKESLQKEQPVQKSDNTEEFTVIGGDLSTKHVLASSSSSSPAMLSTN